MAGPASVLRMREPGMSSDQKGEPRRQTLSPYTPDRIFGGILPGEINAKDGSYCGMTTLTTGDMSSFVHALIALNVLT